MLCPFLPQYDNCCFCIKNLTVACVFIIIWTDLILCHTMRILISPSYEDQYATSGVHYKPLICMKWLLFGLCLTTILCGFLFFLGLFFPKLPYICIIYLAFCLITSLLMLVHGIFIIVNIIEHRVCSLANISDGMVLIVYSNVWFYFQVIINSYSMEEYKNTHYVEEK